MRETDDPIAILDAVRRAADRVDIFAQAGQIVAPRTASDLVAFLEPMIHLVVPPRRGSLFHPKVWLLEFGRADEREYRFLCSSRNLTGDRSWDVMVRLDSRPSMAPSTVSVPIADLLDALPGMAVVPLSEARATRLHDLAGRVRRIDWEPPADIREVHLHALGIGRSATVDFGGKRHLVISPFLSDDGIAQMATRSVENIQVISRPESLEGLSPNTLKGISGFVLDDAARDTSEADDDPLVGLHAKVVALDRLSGSRVFIGSANATGAALAGNVEFMVELVGPQPRVGVAAVFGEDSALRKLVIPYTATGGAVPTDNDRADHALEMALRAMAGVRMRNTISSSEETYAIGVEVLEVPRFDTDLVTTVHLLTRPGNSAPLPQEIGRSAIFTGMPLTDVTPFLVIRVRDERGEERSTVARAELVGDIPHRRDAVLARQIDSPQKFLQFLLLLLSLGGEDAGRSLLGSGTGIGDWTGEGGGVFEALVKAVGARSNALEDLARLIERLRSSNSSVLPAGFDELWASVWGAHLVLTKQRSS
ncbi:MAG: phospholipase D family protein [Pseudolysinimonas sp.]